MGKVEKYFKDRVAKIFRGWGDEKNKVVGWKNFGGGMAKKFWG